MDELTGAIHDVVSEYGTKRMAADLGMSYHGLLNQINPINDRPPSLSKFSQMVRLTGDARLVQPLLDLLGMVAIKRVTAESVCSDSVFSIALEKQAEAGDLSRLLLEALADGDICDADAVKLKEQIRAVETLLAQLRASIKAMHAKSKGAALKAV